MRSSASASSGKSCAIQNSSAACSAAPSRGPLAIPRDRKSTRLNSSHLGISYAVFWWKKKPDQPVDEVIDVAERPRLHAFAEPGEVAAEQRLDDEVRDQPAVVRMNARAIRIDDSRHLD